MFRAVCWMVLPLVLVACKLPTEYDRAVEKALSSGQRVDTLFLGLSLGMTSKEFYAICWELNKQEIIKAGPGNTSAEQELKDMRHEAYMDFYPEFSDDRIYKMPVTFRYKAWAPWNRGMFADSLEQDVLNLMEKWYGNGFFTVASPRDPQRKVHVKIDGNRRLTVYQVDDQFVKVEFTDLLRERQLEKKEKQASN
ncbi:MAG: hypothetical protein SF053_00040 [Bacteroidia bacterium]|nr:hypothetical protein [Bacteroidia bacterium]